MSPGLDGVPVAEIAGREGLLDRRQHSHQPLGGHPGRVVGVERSEEHTMFLRVGHRADLDELLPAATARALLRTERVRQWVTAWPLVHRGARQWPTAEEPQR